MEETLQMNFPAMISDLSELPLESEVGQWFNSNVAVMEEKLLLVEQLLYQKVDDARFNEAINAIHFMIDKIPLLMNRLASGTPVFRARANADKLFEAESEISYNKAAANRIGAGRFNRPLEPLFYGSLRVPNPKVDSILHCALECCKALTDENSAPPVQDITVGCWLNKGSFPVINLCFDERHLAANPDLALGAIKYRDEMAKLFTKEACDFIARFMRFFSQLAWSIKENENNYYILNAYFYAVRYYYANSLNTAIPGIIYPSAMTDGYGLSIVLVPQAVDYFLRLEKVYMQRFFLAKNIKTYISDPCSELVSVTDGKFQFKKVRPYMRNGQLFTYGL